MRDIERSRMCEERGRVREGDGKGRDQRVRSRHKSGRKSQLS